MIKYIIDRFEEDKAVLECESGESMVIERALLPENAVEGDISLFDGEKYIIDKKATAARRGKMREKMEQLFKKS